MEDNISSEEMGRSQRSRPQSETGGPSMGGHMFSLALRGQAASGPVSTRYQTWKGIAGSELGRGQEAPPTSESAEDTPQGKRH